MFVHDELFLLTFVNVSTFLDVFENEAAFLEAFDQSWAVTVAVGELSVSVRVRSGGDWVIDPLGVFTEIVRETTVAGEALTLVVGLIATIAPTEFWL